METVWKLHDKFSHRDQWTYNQMIAVAAKGGFVKKAFSIFQKMKKIPLQPSLGTFHWLLHACVNGKEKDGNYLSRAFYVVELMDAAKIPLNLHSYNLLLQICANANDIEMAAEVLRKMSASGISADVSSLSSLLNCTRGEHLAPIQQVWGELRSKFTPDERAWNTYLSVLADSKFYDEAIVAFNEMISTPVVPELDPNAPPSLPTPSAYALTVIFDACAASKKFADARAILLRTLSKDDWAPKITFDLLLYQSMLRVSARLKSNIVFAIEGKMIEAKMPIAKASRELFIMAYGRTSDMKGALRHFEAARTAGELNLRCFTGLLIACRTVNDADRALLSFDVLRRVSIKPDEVYIKLLKDVIHKSRRPDLTKRLEAALAELPANLDAKKTQEELEDAELKSLPEEDEQEELEDNSAEIVARAQQSYGRSQQTESRAPSQRRPHQQQDSSRIMHGRDTRASQVFDQDHDLRNATTSVRRIPAATPSVVLPSESPSATRSSFFASERIQRRRNEEGGRDNSL